MQGRTVRAGEFAAAQGFNTEAWYLSMLRNCSLLKAYPNVQRIRDLNKSGYGAADLVNGSEKTRDETKNNVRGDSQKRSKDSGLAAKIATENSSTHIIDDSTDNNATGESDTDGADQFWDAEEGD